MAFLTQSEYARRRGWSRQYVGKLVRGRKISLHKGRVDPAEADRMLAASHEPSRDLTRGNGKLADPRYLAVRARREKYQALLVELKYRELAATLLPAKDVRDAAFRLGSLLCDGIRRIPDRIAPLLVVHVESSNVRELMRSELKKVLYDLIRSVKDFTDWDLEDGTNERPMNQTETQK